METKSISLTDEEVAELRHYLAVTGEGEAVALKRAALRGLKELRLEQGMLAFLAGQGSSTASEIAGLPRAEFLQILGDRGIAILQGPSTLTIEVETLAELLGNERLSRAARKPSF